MPTTTENATGQTAVKTKEQTPKLRCIVTGKERLTNKAYLTQKAEATNGDIEKFLSLYISRPALKWLRKGKNVEETRQALNVAITDPIDATTLEEALKLNGKWSKE